MDVRGSGGTRIGSVSRAARLLLLIASQPEAGNSVANLAKQLGTSVPTTYHMLNTLVDAKFLTKDERKRYRLGFNIGVLAAAYSQETMPPPELLKPLQDITESTGESAYFSVWRDGSIVIAAHLAGTHSVRVANLQTGFQGMAHARASGKTLLAFTDQSVRDVYLGAHSLDRVTEHTITDPDELANELEKIREQGFAAEVEEFSLGVACIAVPVIASGQLLGAYTISCPVDRYHTSSDAYLTQLLHSAAAAASAGVLDEDESPNP